MARSRPITRVGPVALILAATLAVCVPAHAAETVSLAVVTRPGSAQNIVAQRLAALVATRTDGRVVLDVSDSGQAGNESEILEKVKENDLNMTVVTAGPLEQYDVAVGVLNYPFLFDNYDQVDAVLDGPIGRRVLRTLEPAGFVGLGFAENGFRCLTNDVRPVTRPADLAGLRIRVMESPLHEEIWRLLGARPVPMPWPVTQALEEQVVDGQENPIRVIEEYRLYDVQKYMTLTRHVYSPLVVLASLSWWRNLDEADQEVLEEAAREACAYQKGHKRALDSLELATLMRHGMDIQACVDKKAFQLRARAVDHLPFFQKGQVVSLLVQIREKMAEMEQGPDPRVQP